MNSRNSSQSGLVLWIVWAAMLGSLALYFVTLWILGQDASEIGADDAELVSMLTVVFATISVTMLGAIFAGRNFLFFRKFKAGDFDTLKQLRASYYIACIITWALVEAIAIYGFVLALLSEDINRFVWFAAPAALLFVFFFPKQSSLLKEYQQRHPGVPDDDTGDGGDAGW